MINTVKALGLTLTLDSREIFPDDPGQGTPAMVSNGRASATYGCAADTGELTDDRTGETVELKGPQIAWLDSVEDIVWNFIRENS